MITIEHWVIQSGKYFLTYGSGYSLDIDKAMAVREDVTLVGRQEMARVVVTTETKIKART